MDKKRLFNILTPSICAATVVIPPIAVALAEGEWNMDNPLCFENDNIDGKVASIQYQVNISKTKNDDIYRDIEYKYDDGEWHDWKLDESQSEGIVSKKLEIRKGEKLYVKNNSNRLSSSFNYINFKIDEDNKIKASGNVNSLIKNEALSDCCFYYLFRECSGLTQAPELPATQLAHRCYYGMFRDCSSLTAAPELPAKKVVTHSYATMFWGCSSLTSAPTLPASSVDEGGYLSMFNNCTGLIAPPELPAMELLGTGCYMHMFDNCSNMVQAVKLPAKILKSDCYRQMFANTSIKITDTPADKNHIVFMCPDYGEDVTNPVKYMFENTKGITTDPEPGKTYYWVEQ